MKPLLAILMFISTAVFACNSPANQCTDRYGAAPSSFLETLNYTLEQMKLDENPDIRTAVQMYKQEVRAQERTIPVEAFAGGSFNPGAYALGSSDAKILKAQIDLFDTIYLILNDEQKKQLPVLIGIYQHHMKYTSNPKTCSTFKKGCNTDKIKSCGAKNCDTFKNAKLTPKGK